jgi:peptidoglycan hydrolase-like protein with peptidoglycan-binding domain
MTNFITGIIFFLTLTPSSNLDNCKNVNSYHPVKSDIMMQVVLKSYGYYEGNIDGLFGNISKKALINFQSSNNIVPDGIIGLETCNLLLNKNQIVKNTISTVKNVNLNNSEQNYSQEIYDAQKVLKELGLYTSDLDGLNGPGTKRALRNFQSKSGLNADGVLGPLTKSALDKGEESYITVSSSTTNSESENKSTTTVDQSSALDLRNYDPSKTCIVGYVDSNGIWVPDPCFKPVFVYRFGKTAQVNSQQELDAYLADRWSLQKEKTYVTIGRVETQNYTDGINSPVNGMIMPSGVK